MVRGEDGAQAVGTMPEVAIPLAINYYGDDNVNRSLQVLSFESEYNFYEYLPVKFITKLSNTGNGHLIPNGNIIISKSDKFDNVISEIKFNESNKYVFDDSGRTFEDEWWDSFITRNSEGKVQIHWDQLKNFRIGKYHAQLTVYWDNDDKKDFAQATTSFWVIPWKLILIILVLITIIILIIVYFNKKNKGVKKYQK